MKAVISSSALADFLPRCIHEYRDAALNRYAPRQWGILAGSLDASVLRVQTLYYVANIRDVDIDVIAQYHDERAPKFGGVYKDRRRGYQSDSRDVLSVIRRAREAGQEILGSIHMHADLHNFDRPDDLSPVITEKASPSDQDLYKSTGWPLNMILYVERCDAELQWTMSAWAPPDDADGADYREIRVMAQWTEHAREIAAPSPAREPAATVLGSHANAVSN